MAASHVRTPLRLQFNCKQDVVNTVKPRDIRDRKVRTWNQISATYKKWEIKSKQDKMLASMLGSLIRTSVALATISLHDSTRSPVQVRVREPPVQVSHLPEPIT